MQFDAIRDALEKNAQEGTFHSVFSPQSQFNPIPSILSPKIASQDDTSNQVASVTAASYGMRSNSFAKSNNHSFFALGMRISSLNQSRIQALHGQRVHTAAEG